MAKKEVGRKIGKIKTGYKPGSGNDCLYIAKAPVRGFAGSCVK